MVAAAPIAKLAGGLLLSYAAPILIERALGRYIGEGAAKAVSNIASSAIGHKRQGKTGIAAYDELGHFIPGTRKPWKG